MGLVGSNGPVHRFSRRLLGIRLHLLPDGDGVAYKRNGGNRNGDDNMQDIVVFQQAGAGEKKIVGIRKRGNNLRIVDVFNIDRALPMIIDNPENYLPDDIAGDLVLDFLTHPDLTHALAQLCERLRIPLVASGRKLVVSGDVHTPATCCGLSHHRSLGPYGEQFGTPEFQVGVTDGKISEISVVRGASCDATWQAAERAIGMPEEQAATRLGLQVQFLCKADPARWDPIHGQSPVHFAGRVHKIAMEKALRRSQESGERLSP